MTRPIVSRRTAWQIGVAMWLIGGVLLWDERRRAR